MFTAQRVSHDGWRMVGGPMLGPQLAVAGRTAALAWMSRGELYGARSSDGLTTFEPAHHLGGGRFLSVASGPDNALMAAWESDGKLGVWWRDLPDGSVLVDRPPRGVLVGAPSRRFELISLP